MPAIRAVIFDLDGVVRHFDTCDAIERRYGLPLGAVEAVAFLPELLTPATTGRINDTQWIVAIADELARRHGDGARVAADEFAALASWVDADITDLARELSDGGITTAVLTNGTTRVEQTYATLGLTDVFDHLFNSARIGYAKPDRRVFEHAVAALGVDATSCAFTDDSEAKLAGAIEIGIATHHFRGALALRTWLRDLGVAVAPAPSPAP